MFWFYVVVVDVVFVDYGDLFDVIEVELLRWSYVEELGVVVLIEFVVVVWVGVDWGDWVVCWVVIEGYDD